MLLEDVAQASPPPNLETLSSDLQHHLLGLAKVLADSDTGGVRGVGSGFTLLDGGFVTIPHDALFGAHGKWIIENQGVAPDKTILEMPDNNALHRDRAFHYAVTFLS